MLGLGNVRRWLEVSGWLRVWFPSLHPAFSDLPHMRYSQFTQQALWVLVQVLLNRGAYHNPGLVKSIAELQPQSRVH